VFRSMGLSRAVTTEHPISGTCADAPLIESFLVSLMGNGLGWASFPPSQFGEGCEAVLLL
jgi:hypothetical protein